MLGERIEDPHGIESSEVQLAGLGLLPIATRFGLDKRTTQVTAHVASPSFLTNGADLTEPVTGYEIHMGSVEPTAAVARAFALDTRNHSPVTALDGAVGGGGSVVGTMLHGLFENDAMRARTLAALRGRRGLPAPAHATRIPTKQAEYDRLEAAVRTSLDLDLLWRIVGLAPRQP